LLLRAHVVSKPRMNTTATLFGQPPKILGWVSSAYAIWKLPRHSGYPSVTGTLFLKCEPIHLKTNEEKVARDMSLGDGISDLNLYLNLIGREVARVRQEVDEFRERNRTEMAGIELRAQLNPAPISYHVSCNAYLSFRCRIYSNAYCMITGVGDWVANHPMNVQRLLRDRQDPAPLRRAVDIVSKLWNYTPRPFTRTPTNLPKYRGLGRLFDRLLSCGASHGGRDTTRRRDNNQDGSLKVGYILYDGDHWGSWGPRYK